MKLRDSFISTLRITTIAVLLSTSSQALAENLWETMPFPESYPEPDSSGYSEINGIKLFHAEWGEGEPVILLHGGLGSIEAWALQIPEIATKHRVIAVDSRGHGRSTHDDKMYSYELMASDVIALMDDMEIEKADFLGWSDGGVISLELAINHSERISGALVIGTNYNLSGIDPSVETNEVFGQYVDAAAALYSKNSATPDGFEKFVGDISNMWGTQPDFTEDQLKSIEARFTVVQALEDEAIIDEHAEKMASLIPGADYIPMEGVSHFAMWQDPERMNAVVREYLK